MYLSFYHGSEILRKGGPQFFTVFCTRKVACNRCKPIDEFLSLEKNQGKSYLGFFVILHNDNRRPLVELLRTPDASERFHASTSPRKCSLYAPLTFCLLYCRYSRGHGMGLCVAVDADHTRCGRERYLVTVCILVPLSITEALPSTSGGIVGAPCDFFSCPQDIFWEPRTSRMM